MEAFAFIIGLLLIYFAWAFGLVWDYLMDWEEQDARSCLEPDQGGGG